MLLTCAPISIETGVSCATSWHSGDPHKLVVSNTISVDCGRSQLYPGGQVVLAASSGYEQDASSAVVCRLAGIVEATKVQHIIRSLIQ